MKTYHFKTWPEFYKDLGPAGKPFEVREFDPEKPVEVGDQMVMDEWDPRCKDFSGEAKSAECTYVLKLSDCPGILECQGSDCPGRLDDWRVYGLGNWK